MRVRLSAVGAAVIACIVSSSIPLRGAAARSRIADVDGNRIHYEDRGSGSEALVFVHGWTCNLSFWNEQASAFEGQTRVLAVDLPGHGASDKPKVSYTMDLFARAIDGVLEDAGVARATLVGHSMGTPVIRQFYRRYPEKTRALVVVDGMLRPMGDPASRKKFLEPLRGPNYAEAAGRFVDGMLTPVADESLRRRIREQMLATPQHVAVSAMEGMMAPEIWQPDKIDVPVLAVYAKAPYLTPDYEQFVRNLAPKVEYRVIEGVSHFLMMERPADFNGILARFLAKK